MSRHSHKKRDSAHGWPLWLGILFAGIFFVFAGCNVSAQTLSQADLDRIEEEIESKQEDIQELEAEIERYQRQINEISKEKQSLESAIETLEITEQKLNADIALVQSKIGLAEDTIAKISADIEETERKIDQNKDAVAETIRHVYKEGTTTLVEAMLAHENLSDFWGSMDTMLAFQSAVSAGVRELEGLQDELALQKGEAEALRREQVALRGELEDKANLVVVNKQEQAELLAATASQEAEYQRLLNERLARKEAFEAELRELEAELNLAVDPGAIPAAASGVLSWPLDSVYITQYFGTTAFSTANPQVYSGQGHNGIDLGVAVGSTVRSAADGVIKGTGNTDLTCRNASYGKWILVEHNNGLSTLYAHLSQIGVSEGQAVSRGQAIGYSGNTGYSTGPHLHFTVYATQGVQIANLQSRACGTVYTLPLADQDAYLNPLSYL